ncbi:unnamed protein product [Orchesella dallaii]|uniref:CCHC-type domain-containing protein n=1 Tax=Orchesella dallaii TaxID=48710 RepID=A0ABP1R9R5_9HEXA
MAYRVLNSKQKKSAIWHQKKSQSNVDFWKAPRPFDTPGYHVFRNERRKRIVEPYEVKERHPFIPDIQSWYLPRDKMIPPHEPFNMNDIMRREIGGKVWVDNKMTFDVMLQTLMSCKRHITHDLEMAYERSYDGNLVALLQFSTGMENFLVDVFPLWNQIPRLKEWMEDPEKVKAHSIMNGIKIPSRTQTAVVKPSVRSEVRRVHAQTAVADTFNKRTVEIGTEEQFQRKYANIQTFDQELIESEKLLEKIDEMMETEENEKLALKETFSRDFVMLNSQMEMEKEPGELEDMDTYDANANTGHHDTTTTNQEENPAEYGENNDDVLVIGISDKDKLEDNLDCNDESNYVKVHTATMQTFFVKDVTNNPNVSVKERYRLVMKNVCMKCICKDTGHIGRNCPFKHLDDRSPEVQRMIVNNKRMLHTTNPFIKEHEARRHYDRHQRAKVLKGKSVNSAGGESVKHREF